MVGLFHAINIKPLWGLGGWVKKQIRPEWAQSIGCQAFSLMNWLVILTVWHCHTLLMQGLRPLSLQYEINCLNHDSNKACTERRECIKMNKINGYLKKLKI